MTSSDYHSLNKRTLECGAQENASAADVLAVIKREPSEVHSVKCIYACLLEQRNLLKDQKIDVSVSDAYAIEKAQGDATKEALYKRMYRDCADVTDADRCEAGAKTFDCIRRILSSN